MGSCHIKASAFLAKLAVVDRHIILVNGPIAKRWVKLDSSRSIEQHLPTSFRNHLPES